MRAQQRAYAFGLVTVLLWSTVATAFKLSLRHLSPSLLLLYASSVSLAVLGGLVVASGRVRQLAHLSRRDWAWSLGLGALNPCLYYLVLFAAYARLPAQQAQPLNYTWALTLAWLSALLLEQRLGRSDVVAGLVCYAGVLVIATRGEPLSLRFTDPLGVGLALGSTVIWSLYWIGNARRGRDPVVGLFLNFAAGTPMVLLYCLLTGGVRAPSATGWLGAAYVGCFEMGVTFATWATALRLSANAARVANLIFLSPFLSLVFIHLLLHEPIHPATPAGLALIVGGLVVQQRGARQSGHPAP